jgi:hypothetical protein
LDMSDCTYNIVRQTVDSFMADLGNFQSTLDFLAITILAHPDSFNLKVVDGQKPRISTTRKGSLTFPFADLDHSHQRQC